MIGNVKPLPVNISCPGCQRALQPEVLGCRECGVRMEGDFRLNEFAALPEEDLHFLRIFVHAEGKIRDMESALGLSYPTIRSRLAALKQRLMGAVPVPQPATEGSSAASSVLDRLQAGSISYDEAMRELQQGAKSSSRSSQDEKRDPEDPSDESSR